MNTELLLLASFNDIFALFVGFNIAYLLVNQVDKKGQKFSMFSFLNNARKRMSKRVLSKYEYKIQEIRSNITSIDLFADPIRGRFSDYVLRQNEKTSKLENLKAKIDQHFTEEKCIKTKYMPYLALDCALYGVLLISLSALEHDLGIDIHYYVSLLNTVIIVLSCYCFVYEDNDFDNLLKEERCSFKKIIWRFCAKFPPSIWNTFRLSIIILLVGLIFKKRLLFLTDTFWLNITYILAVVLSIGSIVLYFIICSRNNLKEFSSCTREIRQTCGPNNQEKPIRKAIRRINKDKEGLVKCLSKESLSFEMDKEKN